jgi:hypothetical protein
MLSVRPIVLLPVFLLTLSLAAGFPFQASKKSAEEILTNDSVIQLLKAGLDEDLIIAKIQKSKHDFDLSVQGMVALKQNGISDRLMHFMMDPTKEPEAKTAVPPAPPKEAAPAPAAAPVKAADQPRPEAPAAGAGAGFPAEMGGDVLKNGAWAEVLPEIINWKTGGVLKTIATAGIVKGDVNGFINGSHSRNAAPAPLEFLIIAAEAVAITEYQLIHLREKDDRREFRTVTGGVFHASGGATRDMMQFDGTKLAPRTFLVKLPTLGAGEYGFLPPGAQGGSSTAGATNIGKMYTFRVGE